MPYQPTKVKPFLLEERNPFANYVEAKDIRPLREEARVNGFNALHWNDSEMNVSWLRISDGDTHWLYCAKGLVPL